MKLLRDSRASGDKDGIDRALKALMPDSKGLGEFTADGSRYAEFRKTAKKTADKLAAQQADIDKKIADYNQGLQVMEGLVQKYQATEQMVELAKTDDAAFVQLVEQRTGKKFNDVAKRVLEKALGKQTDPELAAVKAELKAEREARLEQQRKEQEQREHQARTEQIQRHLVFLDQTLSQSQDPRVVALAKTPEGMRAIFEAQQAHYDPRTNVTLTPEQAAHYVLEQAEKNLQPWQRVFGWQSQPPAQAAPAEPPPPPAPRARTLSAARATSASGGKTPVLSDAQLFEKYERIARLPG